MMWFNVYVAFLQYLQFTYQRGALYRLRSLGERANDMDITIDGFHSWMWKGIQDKHLLPTRSTAASLRTHCMCGHVLRL